MANHLYYGDNLVVLRESIKGGLVMQGYAVCDPVPPQAPLSGEGQADVRRALEAIGGL